MGLISTSVLLAVEYYAYQVKTIAVLYKKNYLISDLKKKNNFWKFDTGFSKKN